MHRDLITEPMQKSELLAKYQPENGFTMNVASAEKGGLANNPFCVILAWNDLVCNTKEPMLFGAPLEIKSQVVSS